MLGLVCPMRRRLIGSLQKVLQSRLQVLHGLLVSFLFLLLWEPFHLCSPSLISCITSSPCFSVFIICLSSFSRGYLVLDLVVGHRIAWLSKSGQRAQLPDVAIVATQSSHILYDGERDIPTLHCAKGVVQGLRKQWCRAPIAIERGGKHLGPGHATQIMRLA